MSGEPELELGELPNGWSEKNGGECRSCRAPIRWARNDQSGRMSPFDLDGKSHFRSCPNADQHRSTPGTVHRDPQDPLWAPPLRAQADAGGGPGSGAAAAVAVIEASRRAIICRQDGRPVTEADLDAIAAAIAEFDRATGVSR